MNKIILIPIVIAISVLVVLIYLNQLGKLHKFDFSIASPLPTIISDSDKKTIQIGNKLLNVELATTPTEWSRGLSNRTSLEKDSGMIFIFPSPQIQSFWMKNTLIPLDIIWVANKQIVGIARMFPELGKPSSQLKRYQSPVPVDVVIETNLDWTTNNNIKIGDLVSY